ncbi:MAG: TonB-dependent receptor, partial [bacterium]|nr:TonB-dependent receptor [Candidatus Kapabacteria bacterium]
GDTLMFGSRISNFGGPGGALPVYREFDRPARAHAEASIGTYISPRVMVHGEYNQRQFDLMGTVDYRGTDGHLDLARASSLLLDARGGVLLGGDDPTAPRVRITAGFDRIGDSYFLYGHRLFTNDRARVVTRFNAALASAQDALLDYDIYFRLEHSSVSDVPGDATALATASTPGFGIALSAGNDTLRGRLGADYQISTLKYGGSARTPNWVAANFELDWHPNPQLLLTAGARYSGAQHSDTGSTNLFLPRVSARYQASRSLSLFAWYAPELRAPSYRNRIMQSPYVDRKMVLRAERVPVNVAAGLRFSSDAVTLEGRVLFETADNTPVVNEDSSVGGALFYHHVESRTLALRASAQMQLLPSLALLVEAQIGSSVDVATDDQLPMTPLIDARLRADYSLSNALGLFAAMQYKGEQNTTLDASDLVIAAHVLVDAGASYQLSDAFAVFAEVTNLLGTSYEVWGGYEAPGFEARGGVRFTF